MSNGVTSKHHFPQSSYGEGRCYIDSMFEFSKWSGLIYELIQTSFMNYEDSFYRVLLVWGSRGEVVNKVQQGCLTVQFFFIGGICYKVP